MSKATPSSADLRALIAHTGYPIYVVAGKIPLNPITLSAILNDRLALRPTLASRVVEVCAELEAEAMATIGTMKTIKNRGA